MALDSIAEGFLGGVLRIVLWVAVEIVFEILIKGLGYIICRPFKTDISDGLCALVGTLAWIILVLLLLWVVL